MEPILTAESIEGYDDSLPIQVQSASLQAYIDDLRRIQAGAQE